MCLFCFSDEQEAKANTVADEVMQPLSSSDEEDRAKFVFCYHSSFQRTHATAKALRPNRECSAAHTHRIVFVRRITKTIASPFIYVFVLFQRRARGQGQHSGG